MAPKTIPRNTAQSVAAALLALLAGHGRPAVLIGHLLPERRGRWGGAGCPRRGELVRALQWRERGSKAWWRQAGGGDQARTHHLCECAAAWHSFRRLWHGPGSASWPGPACAAAL